MHIVRDLRYAFRGLARSPLFTSVALLSIALGIGANTAIFTLVDEVLLRRLPVKSPDQLVLFNGARNHYGSNSGGNMLSFPMYEDFRDDFVARGTAPALRRVSLTVANGAAQCWSEDRSPSQWSCSWSPRSCIGAFSNNSVPARAFAPIIC